MNDDVDPLTIVTDFAIGRERADGDAAVVRMRAEDVVRTVVVTRDQPVEFVDGDCLRHRAVGLRAHDCSSAARRAMACSGIGSQVGAVAGLVDSLVERPCRLR